jgi:hypothetical protein
MLHLAKGRVMSMRTWIGIGGGVALILALIVLWMRRREHDVSSLFAAHLSYVKWVSGETENKGVPQELEEALSRYPELHSKYDALIAQHLLSGEEPAQAIPYMQAVLRRTQGLLPDYEAFAARTLLIVQGKLAQALKEEKAASVHEEPRTALVPFGGVLAAFHLLRIAALEQAAGTLQEELAAWNTLEEQQGTYGYQRMESTLREGSLSLSDYICYRKTAN